MSPLADPGIESADWGMQAHQDDALYQAQIGYLLSRSEFYQRKLGEAGIRTADDAGRLADIARLPLTGKDELRKARERSRKRFG